MNNPMTACGCFEAIAAMLPCCNGIMVVNRDYMGMTPSGMKFTTLAGMAGGGMQTPGFMGVSKHYMTSPKLFLAEGGSEKACLDTQNAQGGNQRETEGALRGNRHA